MIGQIVNLLEMKHLSSIMALFITQFNNIFAIMTRFWLRSFRIFADTLLDTLGIFYWSKRNRIPPITNPLLLLSATELTSKIRSGEIKCETIVQAYINRIKQVNPLLNAVVYDRFEDAIQEAKDYDKRIEAALKNPQRKDSILNLPLLGLPITIKECIAVKGMPISAGLYSRKEIRAPDDSPAVRNLKNAGAIVVGVTNVPEFLLWWDTNNRLYGRTNNPYDLARISGGSSGGEGAILSAAGSIIGLGSDIGGSIRIPSFCCGVFGHKPTSHIIDTDGSYPYCGHPDREKFLVMGPICRYAIDLKLVLKQTIGDNKQILDKLKLDEPIDLKKSKFYFLYEDGDPSKTKVSEDIKNALERARYFLENDCGFSCSDADLPLMKFNFFIWLANLSDCDAPMLAEEITERRYRLNGYTELIKSLLGISRFRKITCLNVIGESLLYSQETREKKHFRKLVDMGETLRKQLDTLLDNNSILIMPCLPDKPPKHNGTFLRMNNCGYTAIFNILELPVTQVCMGIGQRSKMPVGFQVVAKRFNDRVSLAVAELLSKEFGGWRPPCEVNITESNLEH